MRRKLIVGNWKMHGNRVSNAKLLGRGVIDGNGKGTVDLYRATSAAVTKTYTGLSAGSH